LKITVSANIRSQTNMEKPTVTSTDEKAKAGLEKIAPKIVTLRAICISCALIPILAMWVVQSELIWYTGHSTAISLFFHVTTVVFVISLLNLLLKKWFPRAALWPGELLTMYVMLSVAGTLCSHDMLQVLIPMLSFPVYAANSVNRWPEILLPHLPSWAIVSDKSAATAMAVGNASVYNRQILMAWLKPLAFWSLFMLTLMWAMCCLMSVFRQPWTEKERLSFPIIQIPLIITTKLTQLLRNKLFWIAFGLTVVLDVWNGFSHLYPALPEIPIIGAFKFQDYFVERPWNAIQLTEINLYPFVIGLAFFLPTDLAFSCWFFFIIYKLQLVMTSALGIRELPGFPFPSEQAAGAYLAVGLLAIWLARRHLAGIYRTIFGKPGGLDESREPMRYRTAVIGLLVCFGLLVFYGVMLGAGAGSMIVFFIIFFLYALAIARMRAELGPPAHDLHAAGPEMFINNALGTANQSKTTLSTFSLFYGFNRAYRAHFAAHAIEGFKIAQLSKLTSRSMLLAMAVSLVVGFFSAIWALLHALYVHGYSGRPAGSAFASGAWVRLESWLSFPEESRVAATVAAVGGGIFALFLGSMRMRFTWWIWHPVGYATCSSWSMEKLWACVFIAWLVKSFITRYGGAKMYKKAIPFFVGLVLGEFVTGSIWCIWGAITKTEVYHFWG